MQPSTKGDTVNSTLVVLEVSQKQNYIFRTNKLKENIGASMIIREVTEDLPDTIIKAENLTALASEVFKGGGKSVYEFASADAAQTFARAISLRVRTNYPGAELFIASLAYDPESDRLIDCIDDLYRRLEVKKSARRHSFGLMGLGVAQRCADSQAPAAGHSDDGRLVSAECLAKIDKAGDRDRFFHEILPDDTYLFADEFEDLGGTKNVKNMIAVIAIDGNKMGAKIKQFRANYTARTAGNTDIPDINRIYREDFKRLSEDLDHRYRSAVKAAASTLMERLPDLVAKGIVSVRYDEHKGKYILPMRPLILSGDDICIVCDARIGVELATEILRNIDSESIDVEGTSMELHACAGVAMVRTSYPFFRAHELAEELCSNAKSILPADGSKDESVIDFTIIQGEIAGSLGEIRSSHYNNGLLTAKPYYIHANGRRNSLPYYEQRMQLISRNVSRGTLKEYRVALAKGESSALEYVNRMRMDIGGEPSYIEIPGENDKHCIDFDVIEMLDIYHGWRED